MIGWRTISVTSHKLALFREAAWSSGQSAGLKTRRSRVRVPVAAVSNPRPRSVNSQLSFILFFFCHFWIQPNYVSVVCVKASRVRPRAWPMINTVFYIHFVMVVSRFKFEWTACFSSGSSACSVHVYPDRVALLRFSHTVTVTEPFWLRFSRRCLWTQAWPWHSVSWLLLRIEIFCVTQGKLLVGR